MTDNLLYLALAVLLLIDWRQTLVIAEPGGRTELNPIVARLIERYGAAGVHGWFALCSALLGAAIYLLPDYAPWIAGIACAAEAACVINNYHHGIRP